MRYGLTPLLWFIGVVGHWRTFCSLGCGQVFVDNYLRDLSEQHEGLSRLGPIVAGKKLIEFK